MKFPLIIKRIVAIPFVIILCLIINGASASGEPQVLDANYTLDKVFSGQVKPSNMAFIGRNEILLLDRDGGRIYHVVNGIKNDQPALDVNTATVGYRGLLGIDTLELDGLRYVFLYYTESLEKDGSDEPEAGANPPLGNRLYRYEFADGKLINPKLLLDLPVDPGPRHTGGEVTVGPDRNVYITIGDLDGTFRKPFETKSQNYKNGSMPDGRSGILRVSPDGKPVGDGILGTKFPLNLYFAYGIRNSFGLDWDPLTGKLWDTENGPHYGDEINLVDAGFNSGWVKVQGVWTPNFDEMGQVFSNLDELVSFNGKGKYSEPEFIWIPPVAPTALQFLSTDRYGPLLENDLFVSDANTGSVYHFELNNNRTELQLNNQLQDKIVDNLNELREITYIVGFGRITDMQIGPDGYLYILSSDDNGARIDRLMPI